MDHEPAQDSQPAPLPTPLTDRVGSSRAAHPIGTARGPLEFVGVLLLLGSAVLEIGQVLVAKESEFINSAGDFFELLSATQLFVLPAAALGVLLSIAPRLFFRWGAGLPSGMAQTGVVLGLIVIVAASVFSVGGLVTSITRSSDDDFDVGVGDWTAQLGITLLALAALVLVFTAIVVVRATDTRQMVRPID